MTEPTIIVRETCKSCLEPRLLDKDGLCVDQCSKWNTDGGGLLLALLDSGRPNTEDQESA